MRLPLRSRWRAGVAAGVGGAGAAALVALARRRARRRSARRNEAFARASEGIWPAVPTAPAGEVRIAASRPSPAGDERPLGQVAEPDAAAGSTAAGDPTPR